MDHLYYSVSLVSDNKSPTCYYYAQTATDVVRCCVVYASYMYVLYMYLSFCEPHVQRMYVYTHTYIIMIIFAT